jgi:crossover junction endodeoxyribonuclease RuvC
MKPTPIILGIDPGSRLVGFAAITPVHPRPVHPKHFCIAHAGVLRCKDSVDIVVRIGQLHQAMHGLIGEIQPTVCVIESAFIGINPRSALLLGQARGSLLAACARFDLPIRELSPTEVKKAITGKGNADKEQVAVALGQLMGFDRQGMSYDVSDALAIALTYGLQGGLVYTKGKP